MDLFRKWVVPSLLMVGCIALVRAFDMGGQLGVLLGWFCGAIAVIQLPEWSRR